MMTWLKLPPPGAFVGTCITGVQIIAGTLIPGWALSFASKYLSFHVPRVVPIYDSLSNKEGRRYARGRVTSALPGSAAEQYRWHTASVLFLANHLRKQGIEPDVKLIDVVLYGQAGGEG